MKSVTVYRLVLILLFTFQIFLFAHNNLITTHFTNLYLGGSSSDFDPSFIKLCNKQDFQHKVISWINEDLNNISQLNFQKNNQSVNKNSNKLYVRAILSRADIQEIIHFSLKHYNFNTNITFEFFDIITGEIFNSRTLTAQLVYEREKSHHITNVEKMENFKACLKGTIKNITDLIKVNYRPGILEGNIVEKLDNELVVIDLGKSHGISRGMTFKIYDGDSNTEIGILKTMDPQENLCKATIVFTEKEIKKGLIVKKPGINLNNENKSQLKYIVTNFEPVSKDCISPEFNIESQSLGQWLHDGLSAHTNLFMLAPLLIDYDDDGNLITQKSIWETQVDFTLTSGLSATKTLGKLTFPDVLIRGLITNATVQEYITPGAQNQILRLGVSVEFYDRKTREFLYACQHSGERIEKIVKKDKIVYRDTDLDASFRELCKQVIKETTVKISEEYKPRTTHGKISNTNSDDKLEIQLISGNASTGDLFKIARVEKEVKDLNGKIIGDLNRQYGIIKLVQFLNGNNYKAQLIVSDGITKPQKNDLVWIEGKQENTITGKIFQVNLWTAKGEISDTYKYSLTYLTESMHDELLKTGKFRMLPPNFRSKDLTMVESALTSGWFEVRDQSEIILQEIREPDIIIEGVLGLAEVSEEKGKYRDKIKLKSGIEVRFKNLDGEVLYKRRKASSIEIDKVKSKGKIVTGAIDLSPEFDRITKTAITNIVKAVTEEYH